MSLRMRVWSLASLGGLRIWCCHELWCSSQMQLGSHIAVALVLVQNLWQAGSCSSDSMPSLGTSICCRCSLKNQKKKKKKKRKRKRKERGMPLMSSPVDWTHLRKEYVILNQWTNGNFPNWNAKGKKNNKKGTEYLRTGTQLQQVKHTHSENIRRRRKKGTKEIF